MPDIAQELPDLPCWCSAFSHVTHLYYYGAHLHNAHQVASLAHTQAMLTEPEQSLNNDSATVYLEAAILFGAIANAPAYSSLDSFHFTMEHFQNQAPFNAAHLTNQSSLVCFSGRTLKDRNKTDRR